MGKPTRHPHHSAGGVHGLDVAARKPDLAVDEVEELILDVVRCSGGAKFLGARNSIAVMTPFVCSLLILAV